MIYRTISMLNICVISVTEIEKRLNSSGPEDIFEENWPKIFTELHI